MRNYATDSRVPSALEQGDRIPIKGSARYSTQCRCCGTEKEVFLSHLKTYSCTVCWWGRDAKPLKGTVLIDDGDLLYFKSLADVPRHLYSKPMHISLSDRYVLIPEHAVPYLLYEEGLADMPPTSTGYNDLVLFRTYLRTLDERWRKPVGSQPKDENPAKIFASEMVPATSIEDFKRQTRTLPKQLVKDVCMTYAPALGWDGAYSVSLDGSDAIHWIYPEQERPKTISPALLRRVEKFPPHLWEVSFLPGHLGLPEALMFFRQRKNPLPINPGDAPKDLDYAQDIPL